jgi:hypothetical protein
VVDIQEALHVTRDAMEAWSTAQQHEAPPFSGGVLDAWPAWAVDAFAVLTAEREAVRAYLRAEAELRVKTEVSDG